VSNKAVADFTSLRAENPGQSRVEQLLALAHAAGGEIYERMAGAARAPARQAALWREARAASGRALEMLRALEQRGALDARNRPRLEGTAAAIARADAALDRLGQAASAAR
jgi:hypothetical protein